MRRLLGLLPKFVISVSAAACAGRTPVSHEASNRAVASTPPSTLVIAVIGSPLRVRGDTARRGCLEPYDGVRVYRWETWWRSVPASTLKHFAGRSETFR